MSGSSNGDKRRLPAEGPPGFNPLFMGVVISIVLGVIAGLLAGDEKLVQSNVVYRIVVGAIVAVVCYAATAALWRAWHRRLLKLSIAGHTLDPGSDHIDDEVRQRDIEVAEFMGTTTKAIEELQRRVEELERPE